jgi:hypothetical protein
MSDETEQPRKIRVLSRTQSKRIENMATAYVNAATGRDERLRKSLEDALVKAHEDTERHRRAIAQYKAILEAVCRRHGTQIFDKVTLAAQCARGRVDVTFDQQRITVALLPELEVVENATSVVDSDEIA